MTIASLLSIDAVARDVAGSLVRVAVHGGAARISVPLIFPSGSMIGVELSGHRDGYLVSDMGGALREAEMIGGERQFVRIAGEVAKQNGVRFDHHMFFDVEVPREELTVAVIAVANAAKTAVELTAAQLSVAMPLDLSHLLWNRLEHVFPGHVQKRKKLRGASDEWTFDAAVDLPSGLTLFEVVPPHATAVAATVAKFLDVSDLGEAAPHRVAVVTARQKTPHLALLARNARVVDQDASDDAYRVAA